MSEISRRGLLQMLRPKQPSFSLDTFYAKRTPGPIPTFVRRDDGIATETTNVGVTREARGVVRIREQDCLGYTSFCSVCSERCPVEGAIVVENGRPRVDEERCDGCGICIGVCPAPRSAFDKVAR